MDIELTLEQQEFVNQALAGKNILVDACIGSGKTTSINYLCNLIPADKRVLYLTYNRLLKIDAKSKIKASNVYVQNYHGFAYGILKRMKVECGMSDSIQIFLDRYDKVIPYDVLIIDEYQDVSEESSKLLEIIKKSNPAIQIIVVGDMEQKIYNNSNLDVIKFFTGFLDDYIKLKFTTCFRLSNKYAKKLSESWKKEINGVNNDLVVKMMNSDEIVGFLSNKNPADILCLGSKSPDGEMYKALNRLENSYGEIFNKNTVYAAINEANRGAVKPTKDTAIFTTYDSSKGLERDICVLFDFTETNWDQRIKKPDVEYDILRNIFLVAASRGKKKIIFVNDTIHPLLSFDTIATPVDTKLHYQNTFISKMFDFKFREDIESCYKKLKITKIDLEDNKVIDIKDTDGLIDLTPCIGIYQEQTFFAKSSIQKIIDLFYEFDKSNSAKIDISNQSLSKQILSLTALDTGQERYRTQANENFVTMASDHDIKRRLATKFDGKEDVQVRCSIDFLNKNKITGFRAVGLADVVKDDIVYELKFVKELMHEHFLQCACYMVGLNLDKGILWNTRDNTMYLIEIPDKKVFMDAVTIAITKGKINKFYGTFGKTIDIVTEPVMNKEPILMEEPVFKKETIEVEKPKKEEVKINKVLTKEENRTIESNPIRKFAVIDCETNIEDKVISIGVVIANEDDMTPLIGKYYIINPEYKTLGMFSDKLYDSPIKPFICEKRYAISDIRNLLKDEGVKRILAYNASFDYNHLMGLSIFKWCDIMKIAYFKKYNKNIPNEIELFKNGRMKKGYSVENMYRIVTGNKSYLETHNAYQDALDELTIVRKLGHKLNLYDEAIINSSSSATTNNNPTLKSNDNNVFINRTKSTSNEKLSVEYKPVEKTSSPTTVPVSFISSALGTTSGIYRDIHNGYLKATKIKGRYEVSVDEANWYIERRKNSEKTAAIIWGVIFVIMLFFIIFITSNI